MLNRIPEPIFRTYVQDGLITEVEITEKVVRQPSSKKKNSGADEEESRTYMVTGRGPTKEFRLMLARGGDREFVSLDKLRNYLRERLRVERFSFKPYEEAEQLTMKYP